MFARSILNKQRAIPTVADKPPATMGAVGIQQQLPQGRPMPAAMFQRFGMGGGGAWRLPMQARQRRPFFGFRLNG